MKFVFSVMENTEFARFFASKSAFDAFGVLSWIFLWCALFHIGVYVMCSESSQAESEDELQPTEQDDGPVMEHTMYQSRHIICHPQELDETTWLERARGRNQENEMNKAVGTSPTKPLSEHEQEYKGEIKKSRNFFGPRKKQYERRTTVKEIDKTANKPKNQENPLKKFKKIVGKRDDFFDSDRKQCVSFKELKPKNQTLERNYKQELKIQKLMRENKEDKKLIIELEEKIRTAEKKFADLKNSNKELDSKLEVVEATCRRLEKGNNEKEITIEELSKKSQILEYDNQRITKMDKKISRLEKEVKEKENINRKLNEDNRKLKIDNRIVCETKIKTGYVERMMTTMERRNDERRKVEMKTTNERLEHKTTNTYDGSPLKSHKVPKGKDGMICTSSSTQQRRREGSLHQPPIQEQRNNLPFVYRSQKKPNFPPIRQTFTCPASCGTICAFFVFIVKGMNFCFPKFMKIIARMLPSENQDLATFNCSDSLEVFSLLNLITLVSEERDIVGEGQLNEALQKVTQKCKDYIGLLTLGYSDRRAGHCVVFFKKEKGRMIEVYDPQTEQWWCENLEDYSKINKVQCFEVNIETARQYLKLCDEKFCSLECSLEDL